MSFSTELLNEIRAAKTTADFDALLRLLSEDALRQCGAERSAVVKIYPREGEVVATAGSARTLTEEPVNRSGCAISAQSTSCGKEGWM